ncbi:NAD(+)/NADH kinase [Saliphagus sp. LR7]|uniref:NAD(+)/NADH kinase n=1 Tax=Saliphagus sp. LR7 TaxID=2282654 RepID=UPI000DF78615|nr:NAD(+)/NADH kinase [Saliphagus sp. LR7]
MGPPGRANEGESRVAVVEGESGGSSLELDALSETVEREGGRLVVGPAPDLERAPDVVVCPDEPSLSAVARAGVDAPVLAVGIDGVPSVTPDRLPEAVRDALPGNPRTVRRPVLRVETEGVSKRAFFDVGLLTAEPARISEYSVSSRGETVARFRADGVVVATPQGSHGYASAAGAPVLSASLAGVAVVPVAPFVTKTKQWILPDDTLALAVERDEGAVSLQADDRTVATVGVGSPVSIGTDGNLAVVADPGLE